MENNNHERTFSDESIESGSDDDTDTDSDTSSSSTSSSSTSTLESDEPAPINEKITVKVRKDRSRGKWKLLSDRKPFRKNWFELFPWIDENPSDPKTATCVKCNTTIKAVRSILEAHQRSKKHIRAMGGFVEEPKKDNIKTEKPSLSSMGGIPPPPQPQFPPPPPPPPFLPQQPTMNGPTLIGGMDQITDDNISFFTESPADAAHQAVTSLIDKLVEKYHENRLANLKVQNQTLLQLNVERAKFIRSENQRKLERRLQQEALLKEAQETRLRFLQLQHEIKINAMEDERDAKLRAVEQELVFAKQEYEKKVRLLDSQLSNMK